MATPGRWESQDVGGRLAATKTLAVFGTAIKLSADGMVEAFVRGDDGQPTSVFEF